MNDYNGEDRRAKCVIHDDRLKTMDKNIADILLILRGNGHPEQGIVYRVNKNTEYRELSSKILTIILFVVLANSIPQIMAMAEPVIKAVMNG